MNLVVPISYVSNTSLPAVSAVNLPYKQIHHNRKCLSGLENPVNVMNTLYISVLIVHYDLIRHLIVYNYLPFLHCSQRMPMEYLQSLSFFLLRSPK